MLIILAVLILAFVIMFVHVKVDNQVFRYDPKPSAEDF